MSSIIQTIDTLREIIIRDFVKFNTNKLGYLKSISNDNVIRIMEVNIRSVRPSHVNIFKKIVIIVKKSGETVTQNRTLILPPQPPRNNVIDLIE